MTTVMSNGGTHVTQIGDVKSVTMADEKVELTTVVVDDGNKEVATETATEAPKTDVTTPATTEAKKTPGQTIKGFFSRAKTPKTPTETTDGPTDNNTETTITEPVKKEKKTPGAQWFARKPHLPKFISPTVENGGPTQPQMTCGLNLIDRDEKKINETVTLQFEDIFGEPEGYHSVDCAWKATNCTFRWIRSIVYKLFALIFALPLAIVWGVLFALLTFVHVWLCLPAGKFLSVIGVTLAKIWSFLVRSVLEPFFIAIGSCLGGIKIARSTVTRVEDVHLA